jgi:hypothetical protein
MFRPCWVETCRSVLQLMKKLFVHLLVINVFCTFCYFDDRHSNDQRFRRSYELLKFWRLYVNVTSVWHQYTGSDIDSYTI